MTRSVILPASLPSGSVLETVSSVCDGSQVTVTSGTYTFQNVTSGQTTSASMTDINGSLMAYTPPSGTTRVEYEFSYLYNDDGHTLNHTTFFIDSDEVTKARQSWGDHEYDYGNNNVFRWVINIGGSADTSVGRLASWSSAKTLKMQVQYYSSHHALTLNALNTWAGSSSTDVSLPTLTITAIK